MCAKFNIHKNNVFVTGFYRDNLFLQISPTENSEKKNQLLQKIQEAPQDPTIVYVTLQKTAEDVAAENGLSVQSFENRAEILNDVDVIISSTSSPGG